MAGEGGYQERPAAHHDATAPEEHEQDHQQAAPRQRPLADSIKRRAGRALGADLEGVRVYEDGADGAQAYARGDELHFAPGAYQPDSDAGARLVAHELVHVLQQRAGARGDRPALDAPRDQGALEDEAEELAPRVARGEQVTVRGVVAPGTVQYGRQLADKQYQPKDGAYQVWIFSDDELPEDDAEWKWLSIDGGQGIAFARWPAGREVPGEEYHNARDAMLTNSFALAQMGKPKDTRTRLIITRTTKLRDEAAERMRQLEEQQVREQQPRVELTAEEMAEIDRGNRPSGASGGKKKKKKKKAAADKGKAVARGPEGGSDDEKEDAEDEAHLPPEAQHEHDAFGVEHGDLGAEHDEGEESEVEPDVTGGWQKVMANRNRYNRRSQRLRIPIVQLNMNAQAAAEPTSFLTLENSTFGRQSKGHLPVVRFVLPKELPRDGREVFLRQPVNYQGTVYRLDFFETGEKDKAWGISPGGERFLSILPYDEAATYSRQALLTKAVTGYQGKFSCTTAPMGTPFHLRAGGEYPEGVTLEVNDGWGFLRGDIAQKIGAVGKSTRVHKESVSLNNPAAPNTQMLQWMHEHEDVVLELVERAMTNIEGVRQHKAQASGDAGSSTAPPSGKTGSPHDTVYRATTTGGFPVRFGIAMPVPGEEVVLSVDLAAGGTRVALHRSPADKPNWAQGVTADPGSALSRFVGTMSGLQYRLTADVDTEGRFFKGMLGVIPSEMWPAEYDNSEIVMCVADRKVDTEWKHADDVDKAKNAEEADHFSIDGNLAISKVYTPGSLIGVPAKTMKKLSGDFDGDPLHVLQEQDAPRLFQRLGEVPDRENPKLPKHFSFVPPEARAYVTEPATTTSAPSMTTSSGEEHEGRSLAARLAQSSDADYIVGAWSTIADLLCTVTPQRRPHLALEIGELLGLPGMTEEEMWRYVGLGIKAGTDLPKTNLAGLEIRGKALTAENLLADGKALSSFLRRGRRLDNPHRRKRHGEIAEDVLGDQEIRGISEARPSHYGTSGRIMRAVNESLRARRSDLEHSELHPTQALRIGQTRDADRLLADAVNVEIGDERALIEHIYGLMGALCRVIQSNRHNPTRNQDVDRWILRVLDAVQPGALREQALGGGLEAPLAEVYGNVVDLIGQTWHAFNFATQEAHEPEEREKKEKGDGERPDLHAGDEARILAAIDAGQAVAAFEELLAARHLSLVVDEPLFREVAELLVLHGDVKLMEHFVERVMIKKYSVNGESAGPLVLVCQALATPALLRHARAVLQATVNASPALGAPVLALVLADVAARSRPLAAQLLGLIEGAQALPNYGELAELVGLT